MKKLMLIAMLVVISTTAQAGCGVLKFDFRKPMFIRVDRISIVNLNGKYIFIRGNFPRDYQIAAPKKEALKMYNMLMKAVDDCSKEKK